MKKIVLSVKYGYQIREIGRYDFPEEGHWESTELSIKEFLLFNPDAVIVYAIAEEEAA